MKRYHKSFIGLMEQNKDGEWMSAEEVTAELEAKKKEGLKFLLKFFCNYNTAINQRDAAREKLKIALSTIDLLQIEIKLAKLILVSSLIGYLAYLINDALPFIELYLEG